MLQLSQAVTNQPILSLRTGGEVATATLPIINPTNLKIEGWYCEDQFQKETLVLLSQDVRDVLKQGFVVNDYEVLADPEELVRLQDVLKHNFELIGKSVVTVGKKRVGKVSDFAVEMSTLYVQKIYVAQSLLKSFGGGELSVDRNQIHEITHQRILIKDPLQPTRMPSPAPATAT